MKDHFDRLVAEHTNIKGHIALNGAEEFFISEVSRFISIAGTILQSFPDYKESIDARIITHILARSILENYFWLLYIFDDYATTVNKYNELVADFKIQYVKLYNEVELPHKNSIEPPYAIWAGLSKAKDLKSMLDSLRNDYGDRLGYLYFVYRVSSFDTHGKSLKPLFYESFGKDCNFPVLEIPEVFDLVANQYLCIWQVICGTQK
jgi:hypothetical protein